MPSREEIKTELIKCFPEEFGGENEAKMNDCISVAHFLVSPQQYLPALVDLDQVIQSVCGVQVDSMIKYYDLLYNHYRLRAQKSSDKHIKLKKKAGYGSSGAKEYMAKFDADSEKYAAKPIKSDIVKNVLSQALTRIETNAGFGIIKGGKVDILLGFQDDSAAFRKRIENGRHFKDPTVPGYHGEHTHRIQWALISLAKIVKEPAKTYSYIGQVVYLKNTKRGLWDAICDRDGGEAEFVPFKADPKLKEANCDFRAPELLTKFIMAEENKNKFPLLHLYVRARILKRKAMPITFLRDYVKKKMFGDVTLSSLQKESISKYIDDLQYIPADDLP
jgi:hypothetical protein